MNTAHALMFALFLFAQPVQRIAVMDFENTTRDKAFDWVTSTLPGRLRLQLIQLGSFASVERHLLNNVRAEGRLTRSDEMSAASRVAFGELVGADTMVFGDFAKVGNMVSIGARFVDVKTGTQLAEARIDGVYRSEKDIFDIENDLAIRLLTTLRGALRDEERRKIQTTLYIDNPAAIRAFEDGRYFYLKEMYPDALRLLDQALKLEPNYGDAHFYKGLTLEKLERWNDAIASLNRAAPIAPEQSAIKWSWKAPAAARKTSNMIRVVDRRDISLQALAWRSYAVPFQRGWMYAEPSGKNTILHHVDFKRREVNEITVASDHVAGPAVVTDSLTVLMSLEPSKLVTGATMGLYAFRNSDHAIQWQDELKGVTIQPPWVTAVPGGLGVYVQSAGRFADLNETDRVNRWVRDGLQLAPYEMPLVRGDYLVVRDETSVRAIRSSTGQDAWPAFQPKSKPFTIIAVENRIAVLEHERAVSILDLQTGKVLSELLIPQASKISRTGVATTTPLAYAVVEGDSLYVLSKKLEVVSIALATGVQQWLTPVSSKVVSLRPAAGVVYGATEKGEILVLESRTGKVLGLEPYFAKDLSIDYAVANVVVATSDKAVFSVDALTGKKLWDVPAPYQPHEVTMVKGLIVTRTSEANLAALDPLTGRAVWQYTGQRKAEMFVDGGSLFLIDENGVTEYSLEVSDSITSREVTTELASAYLGKGDWRQASSIAERAFRESDPNYPPLRLVRSRIERAKGNKVEEARELAVYAGLVGLESQAGKAAIEELKLRHGLHWRAPIAGDAIGVPLAVGDKLLSTGQFRGREGLIVALNPEDGRTVWHHPIYRFGGVAADPAAGRAWYVTGEPDDPRLAVLYSLNMDSGERTPLLRISRPDPMDTVVLFYSAGRLFALTASLDSTTGKIQFVVEGVSTEGKPAWTFNAEPTSVPPLNLAAAGGRLLYTIGSELLAIDGERGTVAYRNTDTGPIRALVAQGNSALISTAGGKLVGFDVEKGTGSVLASLPASAVVGVVRDKVAYGWDPAGAFALNLADSRVLWRAEGARFIQAIDGGDTLLAPLRDGRLLELEAASGSVRAQAPLLWLPTGSQVSSGFVRFFTADRSAYSVRLQP